MVPVLVVSVAMVSVPLPCLLRLPPPVSTNCRFKSASISSVDAPSKKISDALDTNCPEAKLSSASFKCSFALPVPRTVSSANASNWIEPPPCALICPLSMTMPSVAASWTYPAKNKLPTPLLVRVAPMTSIPDPTTAPPNPSTMTSPSAVAKDVLPSSKTSSSTPGDVPPPTPERYKIPSPAVAIVELATSTPGKSSPDPLPIKKMSPEVDTNSDATTEMIAFWPLPCISPVVEESFESTERRLPSIASSPPFTETVEPCSSTVPFTS